MGVVVKKGIEELWASERVTRFISSLGYKEITLESDTEPATIAFRNRVAENCKAEVTLEDAVKGDKPSKGLVANAVMLFRGAIRTIKCQVESCTMLFVSLHEHISRVSFLVCLSVFACTPVHSNSLTTSTDSLACFAGTLTKHLSDSSIATHLQRAYACSTVVAEQGCIPGLFS